MKNRNIIIVGLVIVVLFLGYHKFFSNGKSATNVADTNYTNIEPQREDAKFTEDKTKFIDILDYMVSLENLEYFNMKWDIPNNHTMVVTLDVDNAARVNNVTAVQVYEIVRGTKDNFGYYLQVFNNTFHKGQAKEGDLTIVIKNKKGQEIARTQKLLNPNQ